MTEDNIDKQIENKLEQYLDKRFSSITKHATFAKWIWGLLVGVFLLGAWSNIQLYKINSMNDRIVRLERKSLDYWRTPMIAQLTLHTHLRTNTSLTYEESQKIVDQIKKQFTEDY